MIEININIEYTGSKLSYKNVTKEEVDELRRMMDFFDKSIKNITISEEVIKKINEFYAPKIDDIKY